MSDVPRFVRQRMAQPVMGDHPEANLLAAFAEGGLTTREREQVLLHLGTCATCRETLAVAMPEINAAPPAAAPSGTRWLRWPMLRWAGVGAAVVVVAAAVVIQNSRRSAEIPKANMPVLPAIAEQAKQPANSVAVNEAAGIVTDGVPKKEVATERDMRAKAERRADTKKDASAGQFVNSAPAPANKVAESNVPLQSQAATGSYAAAQPAKVLQRVLSVPGEPVAGIAAMEHKQEAAAPAAQVQSTSESVEVVSQADAMQMQNAKSQDRGQSDLDALKAARSGPAGKARATTGGISVPVTGAAAPIPADSAAVHGGPLMKAAISIPPHWRISSEGALERSTDAGQTWQLVRVAAPPTTLRSFSAVGPDVWAGGTGGALYHSADNGRTWARVTVKADDVVLDSDIVRVEFLDAQHGALITASGETWTTNDAGATWSARR